MRAVVAGVIAFILAPTAGLAAAHHDATHHPVRFQDDRIDESSGAAIGLRDHVLFTHNDSGDTARFFAVSLTSGATLATYDVPGANAVDWEDIAVARDANGRPSVWLADIGDNLRDRTEIDLYRVPEPSISAGTHVTASPDVWRLRYPHQAYDAETLLVRPGGRAFIVTKSLLGGARVYAVPHRPDRARIQVLRYVRTLPIALATGGSVSADGRLLVIRSYYDADLWRWSGSMARTLRSGSTYFGLPAQRQGEGIAIDGASLVLTSEGEHSVIKRIAVPRSHRDRPTPMPTPTSSTRAPRSDAQDGPSYPVAVTAGVVAGLASAGVVLAALRRRRARHRAV
jgi:hypothetical protein